jgi:gamma-glutamyltranspeptidase/glutathione hydrolase
MALNRGLLYFIICLYLPILHAADSTNSGSYPLAIATSNPLATEAGFTILKQGGSTIDAAIAAQMVLTLVEPQSSGIGGGAFLLHWDGKKTHMFDGRETAPAAATPELFLDENGVPIPFYEGVVGGRSVGVPGVLKMLKLAHDRYGRLPWASLFIPAINLAEKGFAISPRLAMMIKNDLYLPEEPVTRAYFYHPDGTPKQEGEILANPELAQTLRAIANEGIDAFYTGVIAKDIVKTVQKHPDNPGLLTLADLAAYTPKIRKPICSIYLELQICGASPPAAGGITVGQILGILSNVQTENPFVGAGKNFTTQAIHLFSEAGRLAYADRDYYIADPDFIPAPGNDWHTMVDPVYLSERATLISKRSMGSAQPGRPANNRLHFGMGDNAELPSTAHFSIADAWGNVLSMTTSIEDAFGSRQMVRGFLLNNQLTDFSFSPDDQTGAPIANRVAGGKRPRSSMSPFLIFTQNKQQPVLSLGSAGGANIINHVAKTLMSHLYGEISLQDAINLPNMGSRNGPTELEIDRFSAATIAALEARGHEVSLINITSGVQGLIRTHDHRLSWQGANDPRREGTSLVE